MVVARTDGRSRERSSTAPTPPPERPNDLSPRELLRWSWRQLTSMRTALILLFLLALSAIPGSVIPQTNVDSVKVTRWKTANPTLAPIYERLGLFDVFGSFWFGAIYLLLVVSLVGCILPRTAVYWRAARAKPPAAPRRLDRLPQHQRFETAASVEDVLAAARSSLKGRRYRLAPLAAAGVSTGSTGEASSTGGGESVAAERGYLREAGNLLFHLAVLVVLAGFAIGALFGFRGGVIVVTDDGFANTVSSYDDFDPGALFNPDGLSPFRFTLKNFDLEFLTSGRATGAAGKFEATLGVTAKPGDSERDVKIAVNHPLTIDGTKVFLIGHGYAPRITVRDGEGNIAYSESKVFLPLDGSFRSFGVVKVPDAKPTQIGLEGEFYPTYGFTADTGPFSAFPDAKDPAISMTIWRGNLGLDDGAPQSIYALDKKRLTAVKKADGVPERLDLKLGATRTLPDGMGTVTLDGVSRFVRLQVSQTPGSKVALGGMILALVGLMGSLFVRPRRVWVRARRAGDRTIVEVAGLDRSSGGDLTGELDKVLADLQVAAPPTGPPGPGSSTGRVEQMREQP